MLHLLKSAISASIEYTQDFWLYFLTSFASLFSFKDRDNANGILILAVFPVLAAIGHILELASLFFKYHLKYKIPLTYVQSDNTLGFSFFIGVFFITLFLIFGTIIYYIVNKLFLFEKDDSFHYNLLPIVSAILSIIVTVVSLIPAQAKAGGGRGVGNPYGGSKYSFNIVEKKNPDLNDGLEIYAIVYQNDRYAILEEAYENNDKNSLIIETWHQQIVEFPIEYEIRTYNEYYVK